MVSPFLFDLASRAFRGLFSRRPPPRPAPLREINIPEGCDLHTPGCDFPECQMHREEQPAGCR